MRRRTKWIAFLNSRYFILAVCLVCFSKHLIALYKFSRDLPFWDEWGIFEQFQRGMTWTYVFDFFNEHRIAVTKSMLWLQYFLDGLNLRNTVFFDFFLYLGCVWLLTTRYMQNTLPRVLFILIAFSTLAIENFIWAVQSQFHLFIGFALLAHQFSLSHRRTLFLLAPVLAILSVYSFGAGVVAGMSLCGLWLLKAIIEPTRRGSYIAIATCVAMAIGLWFIGYHSIEWVPIKYTVKDREYYEFVLNLMSLGFGYSKSHSLIPGSCVLLLFALGCWRFFKKHQISWSSVVRLIDEQMPFVIGMLCVFLVAKGRVNFGIDASKSSRYAELSLLLVPMAFESLYNEMTMFFNKMAHFGKPLTLCAFIVCVAICFTPIAEVSVFSHVLTGTSLNKIYRERLAYLSAGETCIHSAYVDAPVIVSCPYISPSNLRSVLDWTKEHQFSFAVRLSSPDWQPD